ncbi:MAG: fibronectin type III-like domain-contianing protein, partial [Lachnospiraceae bacterium]|nr:fibronectin type III-like domain-contianing protein [Lachnospiraceae bacterium]
RRLAVLKRNTGRRPAQIAGTAGSFGCTAIAEVLAGDVNPSGHLVDTYASNSVSAPAVVYAGQEGTAQWENSDEVNATVQESVGIAEDQLDYYLIYAEGIYVGYKYYETRYEDTILNQGGASSTVGSSTGSGWSYEDEVIYPFGFGLSYTTFSQTLESVEYSEESDSYIIEVTVTNTGDVAGKDVVEIYVQTPYGDYEKENLVEKSSVSLAGYAKTSELAAGESETVTIDVQRYFLASYDTYGAATYILSAGDYYFALGDDAHDALNNILAAKGYSVADGMTEEGDSAKVYAWEQEEMDAETYSTSVYTDADVTNQFDDADLNYYGYDFTYLTRSDWEGTFPTAVSLTATDEIIDSLSNYDYEKPEDAPDVSDFTQGADNGLQLIDMLDVDLSDDASWDEFLDQMTVEEMANLMTDNKATQLVADLGIPGSSYIDDETTAGGQFTWVSHPLTTRTWNTEIHYLRGYYEGIIAGLNGYDELWYGAANLHRTPFNGRTGQYFSEDSILSYWAGYYEVQGVQETGTICCVKHFATNDQETHRQGVSTFMGEQALREVYLRAFEGSFTGGALSTMTALNRIGTRLCKNNYSLITTVLRDEWGFEGHVTSDGYVDLAYFNNTLEELVAGMDYSCLDSSGANAARVISAIEDDGDGYILQTLRQAAKRNLYVMLHMTSINGLGEGTSLMVIVPLWEKALIAVNFISAVGFAAFTVLSVVCHRKQKKVKEEEA